MPKIITEINGPLPTMLDIPRDKSYPADAVQCDRCGGNGCPTCSQRGWLPTGHPKGRRCARERCGKPLPPTQVAVYCSTECATLDSGWPSSFLASAQM